MQHFQPFKAVAAASLPLQMRPPSHTHKRTWIYNDIPHGPLNGRQLVCGKADGDSDGLGALKGAIEA